MHKSDIETGRAAAELEGKTVAVIGYGSQGRAHALNLRDSGLDVRVGLRPESPSRSRAEADGLRVLPVAEAVEAAEVQMILTPDAGQKELYEQHVRPAMRSGSFLGFAHGFNIHFERIKPAGDANVFMVAPKGPGHMVRSRFEAGEGVPCLIAVHQDPSGRTRGLAQAYAAAIGGARAGVLETTFREETETDLFGEQAVLCGGVTELIKAGFETLVEAGYQPQAAYFECLHEMKLIVDLIYEGGLTHMRRIISETAEFGDYVSGPKVIGADSRAAMKRILAEIRDGSFARAWLDENERGRPLLQAKRESESNHPIEAVGRELRRMMSWIRTGPAPADDGRRETGR